MKTAPFRWWLVGLVIAGFLGIALFLMFVGPMPPSGSADVEGTVCDVDSDFSILSTNCPPEVVPERQADSAVIVVERGPDYPMFIEGSYIFLRATSTADHEVVLEQRLDESPGRAYLPPGSYDLTIYTRVCDANCGNLDPPGGECTYQLTLVQGGTTAFRYSWTFCPPLLISAPQPICGVSSPTEGSIRLNVCIEYTAVDSVDVDFSIDAPATWDDLWFFSGRVMYLLGDGHTIGFGPLGSNDVEFWVHNYQETSISYDGEPLVRAFEVSEPKTVSLDGADGYVLDVRLNPAVAQHLRVDPWAAETGPTLISDSPTNGSLFANQTGWPLVEGVAARVWVFEGPGGTWAIVTEAEESEFDEWAATVQTAVATLRWGDAPGQLTPAAGAGQVGGQFQSIDDGPWAKDGQICGEVGTILDGNLGQWVEVRTALEFPISSPQGTSTVASAMLSLSHAQGNGADTIAIYGYAGDGAIDVGDAEVTGVPLSFTPAAADDAPVYDHHDVTALLTPELVAAGWAGFSLRQQPPVLEGDGSGHYFECPPNLHFPIKFPILTIRWATGDPDEDADGVVDPGDACPGTAIDDFPELMEDRYSYDGTLLTSGSQENPPYTIGETGGCSAGQIVAALGLDAPGGLGLDELEIWIADSH